MVARPRARRRRRARGRRRRRCATWSPSTARRRTSSTRPTSGPAPGRSATRSAAYDVYYAGKAFLCTTVARWVAEEGLCLDVCSGGELAVALRAGLRPGADRLPRQQQDRRRARAARVDAGVGRIIVDSFHEIERLAAVAAELGAHRPGDGAGDRRRRGAHPRVHRHRARGPEVRLLDHQRATPSRPYAGCTRRPGLELLGLHSHIGSQIFDTSGFEVAARRVLALHAQIPDELGVELPEIDLGGGFGIAYTTQDDPSDPAQLATEMTKIVEHECRALGIAVPAALDRARPRDRRPGDVHGLRGRHGQGGRASTAAPCAPTSRVDGGMSDNIRTALYDADYSVHARLPRAPTAPPVLARVVGKHCEAGDIVVKDEFLPGDVAPGRPARGAGTGAYCRSMASNYNHALRPPVVAVRDGAARSSSAARPRTTCWRTDVGSVTTS